MKKSLATIAFAVLVTCIPAFAQGTAAPDAATVAAVEQLLATMHARDMVMETLHVAEGDMPSRLRKLSATAIEHDAKLDDKQKTEALIKLDDSLRQTRAQLHAMLSDPTLADEMVAAMVPAYADTYTIDEIHQLTAFYASPIGQKTVARMPRLMERSMGAAYKVMMPRMTSAMAQYVPPAVAVGQ